MILNPFRRKIEMQDGFPVLPGAFPLVGHAPAIVMDLPSLLRKAESEVGTHFWLDFGVSGRELTCLVPDAAPLLQNKVTTSTALEALDPEQLTDVLMAKDGQQHRDLRASMNGPFQFAGITAADLGSVFASMIQARVDRWVAQRSIPLVRETRELVLAIFFRIMGIPDNDYELWLKHYDRFRMLIVAPAVDLPGMPRPRGRSSRAWIDVRLQRFIAEARADASITGLLAAVVRSSDASEHPLSEKELIANLRFMVLAGHETTAATMAWMVIELARHPEVWDDLCSEANTVGSVPRTPKDLSQFPFAEAVFRETVRHNPPVTLSKRGAIADFTLGGRQIRKGTNLAVPIGFWSAHPALYERPDEFLVGRWLGERQPVKTIETLQFGGGPHFCLGYHLVWLETVQFAVALSLTMSRHGLRPHLANQEPIKQTYFPMAHPSPKQQVVFSTEVHSNT